MSNSQKHIAVLASGGDAPGMNAAIRAVVRSAVSLGAKVSAVSHGYEGLIDNEIAPIGIRDVGNIIQRGGSILYTSRSKRFLDKTYRDQARANLAAHGISGVVVIGGEGSMKGGTALSETGEIQVVGIPATIDRDMPHVGATIGFDTAVNTALDAIDRIRDTATTHNIVHIVQVMGRTSGWIGLVVGVGGGAEAVALPEVGFDLHAVAGKIKADLKAGKQGCILVVAEGACPDGAASFGDSLSAVLNHEVRVTTLGHVQRGGNPSAFDRLLASQLGAGAVQAMLEGKTNCVMARVQGELKTIDLKEVETGTSELDSGMISLIDMLS